jgi:organic hydroperoxide reductase OsmC/OhrA
MTNPNSDPNTEHLATIASAHMLSWLHVAFQMEIEVLSYRDAAHGLLAEISEGEYWVSEVILSPTITFAAPQEAMPSALARIHELAHEQCFIARSIKTRVTVRGLSLTGILEPGRDRRLGASG